MWLTKLFAFELDWIRVQVDPRSAVWSDVITDDLIGIILFDRYCWIIRRLSRGKVGIAYRPMTTTEISRGCDFSQPSFKSSNHRTATTADRDMHSLSIYTGNCVYLSRAESYVLMSRFRSVKISRRVWDLTFLFLSYYRTLSLFLQNPYKMQILQFM